MANFFKGQIAKIAQINPETLRFYEKSKLIPAPDRSESGYRLYSEAVLHRLEFIKNAKASGFTLKQIKEMFSIVENQDVDMEDIKHTVDEKIREIDLKISSLEEMRASLINFNNNGQQSIQCPHIQAYLNNFKE